MRYLKYNHFCLTIFIIYLIHNYLHINKYFLSFVMQYSLKYCFGCFRDVLNNELILNDIRKIIARFLKN